MKRALLAMAERDYDRLSGMGVLTIGVQVSPLPPVGISSWDLWELLALIFDTGCSYEK